MSFAEGTTVAVEKTQAEIQGLLIRKHGATMYTSGWMGTQAAIEFTIKGRRVRFTIPIPTDQDPILRRKARPGRLRETVEAEERRRWRCLLLAIKAKLEIVGSGIAEFEEEFLSNIVTDNGATVIERIRVPGGGIRMLAAAGGAP